MKISSCSKKLINFSIFIAVLFLISNTLGWSTYTKVISGTSPHSKMEQYFGLLYVLLHFSFYTIVPVMLFSTVIFKILTYNYRSTN